jgi:hypothetical protein
MAHITGESGVAIALVAESGRKVELADGPELARPF